MVPLGMKKSKVETQCITSMHQYFIYCRKSTEDDDHQAISLESQRIELLRFAAAHSLYIKEVLYESRSARLPGRPVFNQMMARIRKGESKGIIAWHPDRLARNAVDGGQIIHFLDTGRLVDLRFPTYVFEEGPQGKFMLAIVFGYSKYQVDTLQENVKRGNRTKREMGWYPGKPPIGYMNARSDSGLSIIVRDPDRFPSVKRLWELFLMGQYGIGELAEMAGGQFGLRTRRTWRLPSRPFHAESLRLVLRNPFYTGHIVFDGHWYAGKHEAMITREEFNRAQPLLKRYTRSYFRHRYAYGRLIRCGSCDAMITAEGKQKPSGKRYVYYHCTRKSGPNRCAEKSVEEQELDRQLRVALHERVHPAISTLEIRQFIIARRMTITMSNQKLAISFVSPLAEVQNHQQPSAL